MTPEATVEVLAEGVEVKIPLPPVPAQVCVDNFGVKVAVEALSPVSILPN